MKNIDIRKLSPDEQYLLRKIVVRLREMGKSYEEIAEKVRINRTHLSTIWQKYKKGGLDALKPKVRGRKEGERRNLSAELESKVRNLLIDNTPDEIELGFNLWTRNAIQLAVKLVREQEEQEVNVELPLRTITDYQKRWGLSPRKPVKVANKQTPKAYKNWLKSDYPQLLARARKEKFEILWVDDVMVPGFDIGTEAIVSKPETAVSSNNNDDVVNMISAVTNKGKIRFMLYKGLITETVFIDFLSRLLKEYKLDKTNINKEDLTLYLIIYNKEIYQSDAIHKWLNRQNKMARQLIDVLYLENCYLSQSDNCVID